MTTAQNQQLEPGSHLGHYVIVEKIAMGGMGTVYKALEPSLERYVAIKVLRPEFAQDDEYLQYFEQEARAVAALRHPNIVPIYYIGVENQVAFFSMAYIEGTNLDDWIEAGHLLKGDEAYWFLSQAVNALAHASEASIIHLDIKPANFLVDSTNTVMLTDFGLARKLSEKVEVGSDRSAFGTPHFVSPEQILREPTDLRTDVYSLGTTLFFLMSGKLPFDGDTVEDIIWGHLEKPLPVEMLEEKNIAEGWIAIIQKMMARDPKERFQTYAELGAALTDAENFRPAPLPAAALDEPNPVVIPRVDNDPERLHGLLTDRSADWRTAAQQKTQSQLDRKQVLQNLTDRMGEISITPMAGTLSDMAQGTAGELGDLMDAFEKVPGYYEAAAQIAQFMASAMGEELERSEDVFEYLGLERGRSLALLFLSLKFEWKANPTFNWNPLWQHQIAVGMLIDLMYDALDLRRNGAEFAAGALHDLGKIVFADLYPYAYLMCLDNAIKHRKPLAACEREMFGLDHTELFDAWAAGHGFPKAVTATVLGHETGITEAPTGRDGLLSAALLSANHLIKVLGIGYSGNPCLVPMTWAELPATQALWEARRNREYEYEEFTEGFAEHFVDFPEVL